MSGNDPRFVYRATVHAKAIHVTSLSECHRRYGSNAKTKLLDGFVESVEMVPGTGTKRAVTLIKATYVLGGNCLKTVVLNSRSVKAGGFPRTELNGSQPVTQLMTETTDNVNAANVGDIVAALQPQEDREPVMEEAAAAGPARNGRKPSGGFPGDPRYASSTLTASPSDIACLGATEYLSTAVLDCIIQCTALPPNSSKEAFPPMIGSLGCEGYIAACNYTASLKRDQVRTTAEWNFHQRKVSLLRRRLAGIINPTPPVDLPQRLIIPIVNPPDMIGHFFVACFDFDVRHPKFFVAITFYDSLERAKKRIHQSSTAATIVKKVNSFFNTYVLHDKKYASIRQSDTEVVRRVQYKECPSQRNGYDCGIFAVAMVLHLAERIDITDGVFSQANVTQARAGLAETFVSDGALMTSNVFRDCFPCLLGKSIMDEMGLELMVSLPAEYRRRTRSTDLVLDGEDTVTIVDPKNVWKEDIVDYPKKTLSKKKAATVTTDSKKAATVTTDSKKAATVTTDLKKPSPAKTKTDSKNTAAIKSDGEETVVTVVHPKNKLSKKKAVTVTTDFKQPAKKADPKRTATKRHHHEISAPGPQDSTTTMTSTITTAPALMNGGNGDGNDDVNDGDSDRFYDTLEDDDVGDPKSQSSGDTAIHRVMKEAKVESFKDLDDVNGIIDAYESLTGNRLRIEKSQKDKYRVYQCCTHVDCRFQVRFSKRRADNWYVLSVMKTKHSTVSRPNRAADGRKLKKRRQGRLDAVVVRVLQTKEMDPTPGDIMKTAGGKNYKLDVPYMVAYRALNDEMVDDKKRSLKNFQLIVPYLEEMRKFNPLSVIGYTKDDLLDNIIDIHFFPAISNEILHFVRPVISLDAAHLRSEHKGTLYIASVLSGGNDIYPIGFMISSGNEDRKTWTKMLCLLKQACPIICEQGFPCERSNQKYADKTQFLFISDRDKGLKPALKEVFPDNYEMSCAKHIEANVTQRFGRMCGRHVMAMAKTYSQRYFDQVLDVIRQTKPRAAGYIEDISRNGILWSNSQWTTSNATLPPRFGIVTSNTSESVNSMFNSARDLPWMDALEKMVEVMVNRICSCRKKYATSLDSELVGRAEGLIKTRWEATSSMLVMELEAGSGTFSVSSCSYGGADNEDEEKNEREKGNHTKAPRLPLQRKSSHIVKPSETWCSCGQWQDTFLPCRHACAVYRKHKEVEVTYVMANLVHEYYSYKLAKDMFKKNIFPVSVDTLGYDGLTNPPVNAKRSAGRPRLKRYRRRSLYPAAEDSPILCSNCGAAGHNRRTCSRGPGERSATSLLQAKEEGKDEDEERKVEDEEGKEERDEESNSEEASDDGDEETSDNGDEERSDDDDDEQQ